MTQAILQLLEIEKSFPGVKALDKASLNVYPGRVMALMGENGAGKSTLMNVLTGILPLDAGSIYFEGKKVAFKGPRASQEAGISIIHQELNLIPDLTIGENIFLGRECTNAFGRLLWKKMYAQADALLRRLNLHISAKTRLGDVSLGAQQMVEIAKALSFNAKVIIMDEPTDALTDTETTSLFKIINELKDEGCAIVYITHRLKEIFTVCDDVTVLRDGRFIAESCVLNIDEDRLIELMVGRKLEDHYSRIHLCAGETRLELVDVSGEGVFDVSFTLKRGEILGVSGLMGAGRTQLMKIIYGARALKKGDILLNGKRIHPRMPKDALLNGIAYISEDRKGDGLILGLSVKENMSLCSLDKLSKGCQIRHADEITAVDDFICLFNIKTPSRDQLMVHLSGGNQQKVAIAKGLMTKPQVLILDEPTRGVDVGAKKEIYQMINECKSEGMSIILVSSDLPEVLGMSDRILVMHEGRITGEFEGKEANQETLLACAIGKYVNKDAA